MLCHEARRRLAEFDWQRAAYERDTLLMEHLSQCAGCASLARAEAALRADLQAMRTLAPQSDLSPALLQERVEGAGFSARRRVSSQRLYAARGYRLALVTLVLLLAGAALIPFKFREQVGYEIAIAGVDKTVAQDNQRFGSLLGALGMGKHEASTLLDSLDMKEVRLYVGECSETCHLRISDLRTENDVRRVIKAIIDLGCCQIDAVVPIFRTESNSLLGHAARRLLS